MNTAYAFNGIQIESIYSVCECVCCRINNTVTHRNEKKRSKRIFVYLPKSTFQAINFHVVWFHFVLGVERKPLRIIVLVKPYAMTEFFIAADTQ